MKKFLKWSAIIVGSLLALFLLALFTLPLLITPNDFKPQITKLVKDQTGRSIDIPGDIKLHISSSLETSFSLGEIHLASNASFPESELLTSKYAELEISLLPLIKDKALKVGTLSLQGVSINLIKDASGKTNWSSSVSKNDAPKEKTAEPSKTENGLQGLSIDSIKITDSKIRFVDKTKGISASITDFSFTTGHLTMGSTFPLETAFNATLTRAGQPPLSGSVQLKTTLGVAPGFSNFTADDLTINATLTGDQVPGKSKELSLGFNTSVDLQQEELILKNLHAALDMTTLTGELQLHNFSQPKTEGKLAVDITSLKQQLNSLDIALPNSRDDDVLDNFSASLEFEADPKAFTGKNINLVLDQTKLMATTSITNFAAPEITFTGQADTLDLDRYLPVKNQPKESGSEIPETVSANKKTPLPVKTFRNLNFNMDFNLDSLRVSNLSLTKVQLTSSAKNGIIELKPLSLDLYQGTITVQGSIDATREIPVLHIRKKFSGVALEPLLTDLTGKAEISGKADIDIDITTRGLDQNALSRNANGTMSLLLSDGSIKRLRILQTIRQAKALINKEALTSAATDQPTGFATLSASGSITDGVFSNKDLLAESDLMKITGKGTIDLAAQEIDYLLTVFLTDRIERQQETGLVALGNKPIPYRIKGPLNDIQQSAAIEEMLKTELKATLLGELQKQLGVEAKKTPTEEGKNKTDDRPEKKLDAGTLLEEGLKLFGN